MRKSLIKLKTRPSAPKRQTVSQEFELNDGTTLLDLVRWVESLGAYNEESLRETKFRYDSGYEGCYSHFFSTQVPEPIEEYKKRIEVFKKEEEKYEKWYEENKELIEQEKTLRKKEYEEKSAKAKEKTKKDLEKQLLRIQKDIKRLEKGQ